MAAETSTAIASVSIAIAVALITRRQWITARDSLKHELFDRRYAIYERIAAFLAEVLQSGTVSPGRDVAFLQETKTAYFVFACDKAVKKLVSDIYGAAVNLHALEAELPTLSDAARTKNIERQRQIKDEFSEILGSLETRFEKYLRLAH